MATYEDVHAGDIVLGHGDGELWGVATIVHEPRLAVTLVRQGRTVKGWPPAGTEVVIVQQADTAAEFAAFGVLSAAELGPIDIIAESWER